MCKYTFVATCRDYDLIELTLRLWPCGDLRRNAILPEDGGVIDKGQLETGLLVKVGPAVGADRGVEDEGDVGRDAHADVGLHQIQDLHRKNGMIDDCSTLQHDIDIQGGQKRMYHLQLVIQKK